MSRKSTSFRYLSNKSCCLSHFPKTSHFARPTLCHCQSNGNPTYFVVFMLVWGGKKRRQNKRQPVDCFASRDTERRSEAVFIGMHLWHFKVLSQGFSIKCRELIKLIQPNFSHFGGGFLKWRWNSKQRKPQGQIQNWPKLGASSEFWQAFVCIALGPVPYGRSYTSAWDLLRRMCNSSFGRTHFSKRHLHFCKVFIFMY